MKDSNKGVGIMVIKMIDMTCFALLTTNCMAAFNEVESRELNFMNLQSIEALNSSEAELKKVISDVILDSQEKRENIMDLDEKWRAYTESKCRFEIIE